MNEQPSSKQLATSLSIEDLRRAAEASDDPIASNRLLHAIFQIERLQQRVENLCAQLTRRDAVETSAVCEHDWWRTADRPGKHEDTCLICGATRDAT